MKLCPIIFLPKNQGRILVSGAGERSASEREAVNGLGRDGKFDVDFSRKIILA
jgi:hypothetical protein